MFKYFALFILFLSLEVHAGYLSLGESAEVITPKSYRIGGDLQIITSEGGGTNFSAFLDSGWADGMSSRFTFGVGKIDFFLGGSFKYVPFPDTGKQPAMGIRSSLVFSRFSNQNINVIQLAPMASKSMTITQGLLVPYAAIALNFSSLGGGVGTQFVMGSELTPKDHDSILVSGELALNLKDSISYIAAFVSIPFDSASGFKRRK